MSKTDAFIGGVFVGIFMLSVCVGLLNHYKPNPQAIDVYQGRTTLEYKVRDGVKTDSTVVWKD
jgi:hypothetical protein